MDSILARNHRPPANDRSGEKMKQGLLHLIPLLLVLLAACGAPQVQQPDISVTVMADGNSQQVALSPGGTVRNALDSAGISLSQTDRVDPPTYTTLKGGEIVVVTRVTEQFEDQTVVLPFQRLELRNESMPAGETRLIQAGKNGLSTITIRHMYENGIEIGTGEQVSENILQASIPEIVMVGVQSPFAPVPIAGKLAYLTGGNAWIMDESTSNRQPLVTSGDLDGRIFSLSPDGKWLLFTRKSSLPADQQFNALWVVSTAIPPTAPVNLNVANIAHFADWQPGVEYRIAYSTVEPRVAPPGWDANNDLHFLDFTNGKPGKTTDVLDTDYSSIYPWWGMTFVWSPDGKQLAYSRPDSIGLVDIDNAALTNLVSITALNTHSDWAWVPGLAWGSDNHSLYLVNHAAPTGLSSAEESTNFDLLMLSLSDKRSTPLVQQTGMFAYLSVSPLIQVEMGSTFQVAYLQAVSPAQSATSRYRLMVMDQNGLDPHVLFPAEGQTGLEPQTPVWAPGALASGNELIGVIYEGNLWLVDTVSGRAAQVTGDGLTSRIDWK